MVGSSIKEVETLNFFKRRGIKRVYGSYQGRPVSETDVIAAWNAKLDAAGIESQFLMSENSWIFPEKQASFLDKITDRVITFNAEQPAENQFDGLHLDIEPQALSDWSSISNTQRREYLQLLNNTYATWREILDEEAIGSVNIALQKTETNHLHFNTESNTTYSTDSEPKEKTRPKNSSHFPFIRSNTNGRETKK